MASGKNFGDVSILEGGGPRFDIRSWQRAYRAERYPKIDVFGSLEVTIVPSTSTADQTFVELWPQRHDPVHPLRDVMVYEVLREIDHPSVEKYHGCVVEDGVIVGFQLDRHSTTLFSRIKNDMQLTWASFDKCLREIGCALNHLHEVGLVHHRVGPETIAFEKDAGVAVLFDFSYCHEFGTELGMVGIGGWDEDAGQEILDFADPRCDWEALELLRAWGLAKLRSRMETMK